MMALVNPAPLEYKGKLKAMAVKMTANTQADILAITNHLMV
jgi:hypothetical protein